MILERSLPCSEALPFSQVSATGENVLIQGIGMDVISVPLHKIIWSQISNLITDTVIVGVRPKLPVKGVSMLLGSGKVLLVPIVTHEKLIMLRIV